MTESQNVEHEPQLDDYLKRFGWKKGNVNLDTGEKAFRAMAGDYLKTELSRENFTSLTNQLLHEKGGLMGKDIPEDLYELMADIASEVPPDEDLTPQDLAQWDKYWEETLRPGIESYLSDTSS